MKRRVTSAKSQEQQVKPSKPQKPSKPSKPPKPPKPIKINRCIYCDLLLTTIRSPICICCNRIGFFVRINNDMCKDLFHYDHETKKVFCRSKINDKPNFFKLNDVQIIKKQDPLPIDFLQYAYPIEHFLSSAVSMQEKNYTLKRTLKRKYKKLNLQPIKSSPTIPILPIPPIQEPEPDTDLLTQIITPISSPSSNEEPYVLTQIITPLSSFILDDEDPYVLTQLTPPITSHSEEDLLFNHHNYHQRGGGNHHDNNILITKDDIIVSIDYGLHKKIKIENTEHAITIHTS